MTLESSSFVFCCFVLFVFSNIVRRCVCTDVMNVILMIVFIEFPFVCNALFVLLLRQTRSLLGANRLCSRRWSATRAGRLRRPALPGFAGFADRHYPGTREKGKSQLPAIGGQAASIISLALFFLSLLDRNVVLNVLVDGSIPFP